MNKTIIGVIVVILIIVGGLTLLGREPATNTETNSSTAQQNNQAVDSRGRVVFSVTDAAANMSTISEINMTVSRVDMHSSASGWTTVSSTPRTYNLLELKASGESKILADVNAKAETYDQVRLMVDSITVKTKAGTTKQAKLPSGELKINSKVVVNRDETSSVNFDFLADKSLHMTGNGQYIFAPVVKTEAKSDTQVAINADSTVDISGGRVDDESTSGMDVDGTVKLNFEIKGNQKLNIGSDNVIKLEF